jgi:hypothetical protein
VTGSLEHHLAYFGHLAATAAGVLAIVWLTRSQPRWAPAVLAAGCLAMALAAFRASDPPDLFHDFWIAYYPAGQAVLRDAAALEALTARGVDGFVNLPIVAWLFAPFGALPKPAAIGLFTALGVGASAAAWLILVRLARLGPRGAWLLALLFAASGPLQYSLKEGNTSHFVLLALAAGLALMRANRSGLAGVVLAGAALIKLPLLVFGGFFLLRRDWRGLTGFCLAGAAAVLASLAAYGWDQNWAWFQSCVLQFSNQWLAAFNVQSIPAFLLRLGEGRSQLFDWTPAPPPEHLRLVAQMIMAALLGGVAFAWSRRPSGDPVADAERLDLNYLLAICLAVVASPLSWSHYYAWLLAPAAFLLGGPLFASRPDLRRAGWAAVALATPLVWPLSPPPGPLQSLYAGLAVSHFLFAGLLMLAVLAARLARRPEARVSASWAGDPAAK